MAWVALMAAAEEERLKKMNARRRRMERALARPLLLPDTDFIGRFRLSKANFVRLCDDVIPLLPTNKRTSGIKPEIKILAALNFYATGSYQSSVGANDFLHLSQQSTSDCLRDVTDALNTPAILRKYIKFPRSQTERVSVAMRFNEKFGFPGVIGCIDGTHLAIIRPSDNEEAFYNRKGYHSLNVLAVGHLRTAKKFFKFSAHIHRMKIIDSPARIECSSNEAQTLKYIFFNCPAYNIQRMLLITQLQEIYQTIPPSLQELLKNPQNFKPIFDFIQSTVVDL